MGIDNPAIEAYTLTTGSVTRFGLEFSPIYSRLQTEKSEIELEGEGLEDNIFPVRFVLVGSFRAMGYPPEPCFSFSLVDPLLIVLYPPLSPPFVLRALRYIAVGLAVLTRVSVRYLWLASFVTNLFSFTFTFPPLLPPIFSRVLLRTAEPSIYVMPLSYTRPFVMRHASHFTRFQRSAPCAPWEVVSVLPPRLHCLFALCNSNAQVEPMRTDGFTCSVK